MSRTGSSTIRAALASQRLVSAELLKIQSFGCSDPKWEDKVTCEVNGTTWVSAKYLTNFDTPITVTVDGNEETFEPNNELANMPEAEEELGMEVTSFTLQFIAIENDWLEIAQTHELLNKTVEVWRVLLDPDDYSVIGNPFKWFSGLITRIGLVKDDEGEGSFVECEVSSEFFDYDRVAGIQCNEDSHQNASPDYANDTGFKFCTEEEVELQWMGD